VAGHVMTLPETTVAPFISHREQTQLLTWGKGALVAPALYGDTGKIKNAPNVFALRPRVLAIRSKIVRDETPQYE
jgi:hypothetical protein